MARICNAANYVTGLAAVSCDSCPFPFCVTAEAYKAKTLLKEHMVATMKMLGDTADEMATQMNISKRTLYRYTHPHPVQEENNCHWCTVANSKEVMCRSNVYAIVHEESKYIIVLNNHRHATKAESLSVSCFIDYIFPISLVERSLNGHDFWALSKFEHEEEEKLKKMCDALDKYSAYILLNKQQGLEQEDTKQEGALCLQVQH